MATYQRLILAFTLIALPAVSVPAASAEPAEEAHLEIGIVSKRGRCRIGELVHFKTINIKATERAQRLEALQKSLRAKYPFSDKAGDPYQGAPTAKLVHNSRVVIITGGKTKSAAWNCEGYAVREWIGQPGQTYDQLLAYARKEWEQAKVTDLAVLEQWPLQTTK